MVHMASLSILFIYGTPPIAGAGWLGILFRRREKSPFWRRTEARVSRWPILERKALLLRLKVGGQGTLLRTCCYAVMSHSSPQPNPTHMHKKTYKCTNSCCHRSDHKKFIKSFSFGKSIWNIWTQIQWEAKLTNLNWPPLMDLIQ